MEYKYVLIMYLICIKAKHFKNIKAMQNNDFILTFHSFNDEIVDKSPLFFLSKKYNNTKIFPHSELVQITSLISIKIF